MVSACRKVREGATAEMCVPRCTDFVSFAWYLSKNYREKDLHLQNTDFAWCSAVLFRTKAEPRLLLL